MLTLAVLTFFYFGGVDSLGMLTLAMFGQRVSRREARRRDGGGGARGTSSLPQRHPPALEPG
eukprot:3863218-Rhodomonas_salina.2